VKCTRQPKIGIALRGRDCYVTGLAPSGIAMLEFGSSGSVLAIMCRISFAVGTCGGGRT
jgi:hypothetical protein